MAEPAIRPRLSGSRALDITVLGAFRDGDSKDEEEFTRHTGGRGQDTVTLVNLVPENSMY